MDHLCASLILYRFAVELDSPPVSHVSQEAVLLLIGIFFKLKLKMYHVVYGAEVYFKLLIFRGNSVTEYGVIILRFFIFYRKMRDLFS
jgi:hypothetical protein